VNLDLSERGLDRGDAIRVRDGERPASDEAASENLHALMASRPTVSSVGDHRQQSFEEHILF
jgi:hypothetical protein